MISFTAIGVFLFTLPFTIIALHSLKEYLKDKQNPQKKHILYAVLCVSIGSILNLIGILMVSPDMSQSELMIVNTLSKLFDVFNIIGLFWFFVFLTDFVDGMKKYTPFIFIYIIITGIIILSTKSGVTFVAGSEFVINRAGIRSIAILLFWFFCWSLIAYQFWKFSKLMTNKIAIQRTRMMSFGAVFAVLAYIGVILAKTHHSIILEFTGEISAAVAGIVFYAGFVAPEWLRRMWEK